MNGLATGTHLDVDGLRERNKPTSTEAPLQPTPADWTETIAGKDEKDKKTFGRTPDGISQLLLFSFTGLFLSPCFKSFAGDGRRWHGVRLLLLIMLLFERF
jgi:hypothetical protein